ncbi:hypothetical protein MTR67_047182 [Solanum verrucosum]|uniref:Uncharacterized protein n=1 Tax=Solanum verrucosum TaxID=315347 RepID=A0AAF0UW67_SOLVR|nr:hypothetical protein MTR67_047182 [Solanum verrucosum]
MVTTCPKSRIQVSQGAIGTIGGIPQYRVQIVNGCESICDSIHVSCGQFASTKLINPSTFRRLAINDCLVNNGAPMKSGQVISFTYTNTFKYPMTVTSSMCY